MFFLFFWLVSAEKWSEQFWSQLVVGIEKIERIKICWWYLTNKKHHCSRYWLSWVSLTSWCLFCLEFLSTKGLLLLRAPLESQTTNPNQQLTISWFFEGWISNWGLLQDSLMHVNRIAHSIRQMKRALACRQMQLMAPNPYKNNPVIFSPSKKESWLCFCWVKNRYSRNNINQPVLRSYGS